jgi:UDP-glucuronate 4-epimerase
MEQLHTSSICHSPESVHHYLEDFSKCILVTGGAGFIGSHIAVALLRDGRKVVIYDSFNSETSKSVEKQENTFILRQTAEMFACNGASLTIINGDIRDQDSLEKAISRHSVTSCIHVAGMVDDRRSVIHPMDYIEINIKGTAILLDVLGKCGVKMVVQASTRSVYGQREDNTVHLDESADRRPVNPYGASKVAADAFAHVYSHLYGMNVTVLRIFSAYGPRGRPDMIPRILVESIVNDKPIKKYGDGMATRTWTYISDVVSAFILALKNPQKGYVEFNVGATNSLTLNEIIACAERACDGKQAIIENYPVPPGDAYTVGHPSCELIQKSLGWNPIVGIEDGLRHLYLHYISQVNI